jgi:hypothetical protein
VTAAPVSANQAEPCTSETLPKLSEVGKEGAGVGAGVGAALGGIVADEPDRNTIKPLVSLVSYGPVSVAVIMSVVNVPAKCSPFPVLAPNSSAAKLALETVPESTI